MKKVDMTIDYLSSCPVCVKLDTLEDAVVALGSGEAATVLGCSEVIAGAIIKAAACVAGCP